jgi:hypothetical protein
MTRLHVFLLLMLTLGVSSLPAQAQTSSESLVHRVSASFATPDDAPTAARLTLDTMVAQAAPVAFEYSDAYHTRAKIHRMASFATLPLFVAEGFLGESLYTSSTPGKKTAHLVIGGAIAGLFAVNSVTGVWNMVEARKDPNGRTRRLVHGMLMLAADVGFLATAMTGPGGGHGHSQQVQEFEGSKSTHRAIAFTSVGLATAGYFTMIIGGH